MTDAPASISPSDSGRPALGDRVVILDSADWVDGVAEPVLPYVRLNPTWNGWQEPVCTAAAVVRFFAEWRSVDPNGAWGEVTVSADGSTLTHHRSDVPADDTDEDDVWDRVDTVDGVDVYAVTGLVFVIPPPVEPEPTTYVVSLPVVITVSSDGAVAYEVDLSEASDLDDQATLEGVDYSDMEAHAALIAADATARSHSARF